MVDLFAGFTLADKRIVKTIIRMLIHFVYKNPTANVQTFGRWGIHQMTDDALAAGAVPDPLGDFTAGWMVNEHFHTDESTLTDNHRYLDIRSKRRLEGDRNTIGFVIESDPASNGGVDWAYGIRILYTKG